MADTGIMLCDKDVHLPRRNSQGGIGSECAQRPIPALLALLSRSNHSLQNGFMQFSGTFWHMQPYIHSLLFDSFIFLYCDEPPFTFLTNTQKSFLLLITNLADDVELHFETCSLTAVWAEFGWHRILSFRDFYE